MKSFVKDYIHLDAISLKDLLQKKEVSVSEVQGASQYLINELNPKLNFLAQNFASPIQKESAVQIPFLLKDCGHTLAGTTTSYGNKHLNKLKASKTTPFINEFLDLGFSLLGKTTTPEFCTVGVTESRLRGVTKNPWNLSVTTGGSSGGAASALAARCVPVVMADDGGGSIRVPAAYCGLVGLKPGINVTNDHVIEPASWMGLVTRHVLTRSTRDSLWVLMNTCNKKYFSEVFGKAVNKSTDYESLLETKTKFKIAFSTESFYGSQTTDIVKKSTIKLAETLTELGHTVVERSPKFEHSKIRRAYLILASYSIHKHIDSMGISKLSSKDVELSNWILYVVGKKSSEGLVNWALNYCKKIREQMNTFFSDNQFDIYLNPTTASPASPHGLMDLSFIDRLGIKYSQFVPSVEVLLKNLEKAAEKGLSKTPNTQFTNLSGHPSLSVPSGFCTDGVPLGAQLTGPMGSELKLLQLSQSLQSQMKFNKNVPDITEKLLASMH